MKHPVLYFRLMEEFSLTRVADKRYDWQLKQSLHAKTKIISISSPPLFPTLFPFVIICNALFFFFFFPLYFLFFSFFKIFSSRRIPPTHISQHACSKTKFLRLHVPWWIASRSIHSVQSIFIYIYIYIYLYIYVHIIHINCTKHCIDICVHFGHLFSFLITYGFTSVLQFTFFFF